MAVPGSCFGAVFVSLILSFQIRPRIVSVVAFCRAPTAVATESSQRRAYRIAKEACNENSGIERNNMSSNLHSQQLFGKFKISSEQIFWRSKSSFAIVNLRPLVAGHVLVCSSRVTPLLSDLGDTEYDDLWRTVRVVQNVLKQQYKCDAFNVAVQDGAGAGQSVPHVHIHILPRFGGDLERNDDIYDQLESWAPRDDISKDKAKLAVTDDNARRDRTEEEMASEAAIYRSLIDDQSS